LDEPAQSRELIIPDGGALLVPLQFRPRAVREKDRWWVVSLTPRILIEEEEQVYRRSSLESVLPALLADVLNNPRLKAARDLYGTPRDKRFALGDSDAWSWKDYRPSVPGHQLMPATRAGTRPPGARLDP